MIKFIHYLMRKPITQCIYGLNCGVGAYRGIESYKSVIPPEKRLYKNHFVFGLGGVFIYANPVFWPLLINKEAERLEINLRGLEINEDYHNLF
jgi:hypothetical protein